MVSPEQINGLISLAEIEYTNALVHPDRYDVNARKKFLDDLYAYIDYNQMLKDYIALIDHHASIYPNDTKYLSQMQGYVSRLIGVFGSTFSKG